MSGAQQVREVLAHIEAGQLLPPLMLLQSLARNPHLRLSVVKDYMARQLSADSAAIEEDHAAIAKFEAESAQMRAEVAELRSKVGLHCALCAAAAMPASPLIARSHTGCTATQCQVAECT